MLTRLLHPGADPAAAGYIAPQYKVGRVGEVMLVFELFGKLLRHVQNLIVHRVPLHFVKVHGQTEVHGESDAVVVDARVEEEAAGGFALAVSVDTLRLFECKLAAIPGERGELAYLDVDRANLNVIDI